MDSFVLAVGNGFDRVLDFSRNQADRLVFETGTFSSGISVAQILDDFTTTSGGQPP